jgi:hypothetical protein
MDLKYLDISVKMKNENFGLFNVTANIIKESFVDNGTQNWMFTDSGLRKYDNNGVPLYDNTGKQLYGINEKGIKVALAELASNVVSNPYAKSTYTGNTKINKSTLDSSVGKIFNSITNNVVQSNLISAASAAGAFNQLDLKGIKCKNVILTGINQDASSQAVTASQSKQKAQSNITNTISTNIQKVMNNLKVNGIAAYSEENNKAVMSVNNLFGLGSSTPSAVSLAIGLGNTGLFDANNKLENTITKNLDLDSSTTIKSENNITNTINNNVNQSNVATCSASAGAANKINISDMYCGNSLTISNINQKAYATALANCIFDQTAISNITNTIKTQISSSFDQVYDGVLNKIQSRYTPSEAKTAYQEYYNRTNKIDALGRLHANAINTASCATSNNTIDAACLAALQNTPQEQEQAAFIFDPLANKSKPVVVQQKTVIVASESNRTMMYIIIGVVVLIIMGIIMLVASRKN